MKRKTSNKTNFITENLTPAVGVVDVARDISGLNVDVGRAAGRWSDNGAGDVSAGRSIGSASVERSVGSVSGSRIS